MNRKTRCCPSFLVLLVVVVNILRTNQNGGMVFAFDLYHRHPVHVLPWHPPPHHHRLPRVSCLRHRRHTSHLYYSTEDHRHNHKESDDEDAARRRRRSHMQAVRSLQVAFYKSAAPSSSRSNAETSTATSSSSSIHYADRLMDWSSGRIWNLPLWRVPWMEVPGRSNVWNVHEPMYTNLFETILHSEPPWLVGHLYSPTAAAAATGSQKTKQKINRKKNDKGMANQEEDNNQDAWYKLQTWKQRAELLAKAKNNNNNSFQATPSSSVPSSVIGTLLKIADYRRMEDGRLLLLVQSIERFIVTDIVQELPYAKAHVQLLPDIEEVEDSDWKDTRHEHEIAPARALAVAESLVRWHRYEYENTMLPLPLQSDLPAHQVIGSALAKVLPYAPYSSVIHVETLAHESLETAQWGPTERRRQQQQKHQPHDYVSSESNSSLSYNNMTSTESTLEHCLEQQGILRGYNSSLPSLVHHSLRELSLDQLEIRLWLALNDFLKQTRTPVSPILLGLLPHLAAEKEQNEPASASLFAWPADFVLEKIAQAIDEQTVLDHKYVRVSPFYPALRRQKRLSYSAAALLEQALLAEGEMVTPFRLQLLEISSVHQRLAYVLQCVEDRLEGFQ